MGSRAGDCRGDPGARRPARRRAGPVPAHAPAPPQKCLRLDPAAPVWAAKQRVLCALNHSLQDALNYGLFQPPSRGRVGKFLDEQRLLREYPPNLDTPLPYLEVSGARRGPGGRGARGAPPPSPVTGAAKGGAVRTRPAGLGVAAAGPRAARGAACVACGACAGRGREPCAG